MNTILSVENTLNWSWSFTLKSIMKQMYNYKFIRVMRIPGCHIADDLVKFFDITLLQNLDTIHLVRDKKKVISRIGGLFVNRENPEERYDKELKQVAGIIATNCQLYNIGKRVNKNTFLIPNGVDLGKFKPAERKEDRPFTVGFAGNIWGRGLEYKGWTFYTQVTARLFGEIEEIHCLFNHNQIAHSKMPKEFYHKIDCLILPSKGEGCSNVTVEALACGVPVLLTKVGYHGEMLTDRKNCLFIKRDSKDIEDKIRELISNVSLREKIANNGRKFAEKYHDIKQIAKQYDRVFKEILKQRG